MRGILPDPLRSRPHNLGRYYSSWSTPFLSYALSLPHLIHREPGNATGTGQLQFGPCGPVNRARDWKRLIPEVTLALPVLIFRFSLPFLSTINISHLAEFVKGC